MRPCLPPCLRPSRAPFPLLCLIGSRSSTCTPSRRNGYAMLRRGATGVWPSLAETGTPSSPGRPFPANGHAETGTHRPATWRRASLRAAETGTQRKFFGCPSALRGAVQSLTCPHARPVSAIAETGTHHVATQKPVADASPRRAFAESGTDLRRWTGTRVRRIGYASTRHRHAGLYGCQVSIEEVAETGTPEP